MNAQHQTALHMQRWKKRNHENYRARTYNVSCQHDRMRKSSFAMHTENANTKPTYKFAICVSVSIWPPEMSARIFGTLTRTHIHYSCIYTNQSLDSQSHLHIFACSVLSIGKTENVTMSRW